MKRTLRITTIEFTGDSIADLRGKQSVRTTFKLSERAIKALAILAGQMGIKQKSLFDHLIDDAHALKTIATEYDSTFVQQAKQPKTYVISRRTLDALDVASKKYGVPRDALVEGSIDRIMPLVRQEKKKHFQRKELHQKMVELVQRGRSLLLDSDEIFEQEDPVYMKYFHTIRSFENSCADIEKYLQKGQQLEEF